MKEEEKKIIAELEAEAEAIDFDKLGRSFAGATLKNSGDSFDHNNIRSGAKQYVEEFKELVDNAIEDRACGDTYEHI